MPLQWLPQKLPVHLAVAFFCKRGTKFFQPAMKIIGIAVIQKTLMARIRAEHLAGVLDRVEVLLDDGMPFIFDERLSGQESGVSCCS